MIRQIRCLLTTLALLLTILSTIAKPITTGIDTIILVDKVQVTAIKQGLVLRNQPITATILGMQSLTEHRITDIKGISSIVPNFYIPDYGSRMTSSLYVRGLGARIDQPVMGLNIDNVPVLNKNNYDFDLADAERIEVLRGPQSTLYGRNTMGGVINIYTLSPLSYEGLRLGVEYGSGQSWRLHASSYYKLAPNFGVSVTGYYTRSEGFFKNLATDQNCDWERMGGGRVKTQWRGENGLRIDNTLSVSSLRQGGYPYAFVQTGQINYNDPSSYRRTNISDGLTIRYDAARFSVASITSYQYSNDEMILDQDFLPISYFTLRQAQREHTLTEDVVFKSRETAGAYRWLFGLFGFYKHGNMNAPVNFKKDGIEQLILGNANQHDPSYNYTWDKDEMLLGSHFRSPSFGAALYHESNFTTGRWLLTVGLRFDYERTTLKYTNDMEAGYRKTHRTNGQVYPLTIRINKHGTQNNSFTEVLPKIAVTYHFSGGNNLYASISKGYKAGGFNTQMFSDILQQQMMEQMGFGTSYNLKDVIAYKPERSWNYEIGGHFSAAGGNLRGDAALFLIDCRDQQLTVFPTAESTGRMMTNAGRTRSFGGELSLQASPYRQLDLSAAYGYTNAKFIRFDTFAKSAQGGKEAISYKGRHIPYAPQQTLSVNAAYTLSTGWQWIPDIVFQANLRGVGRIWWNESNNISQSFYTLADASVRFQHKHYALTVWGRNLGATAYDTFYFESIGNAFVQRGRPRTFGVTLNVNL